MTDAQKMVRLNLDLSPELNQILDELAKKIGTNKSDVLRQAITLMQIMVIAKEETKKLGVPEANQLIANEIILSSEQQPKPHPLDTFMERLGPWEDERTAEEIVKDIFDLLIASVALTENYTLVTNNTRHYERINGLKLENWTLP
ncbi:ribbon-helix-helix protein, CopG family [Nostoc sp.]|uniref:ribbon-helix-helix protein, CopG family n=1 Tax=Nostoc sp. TaxID=1180 RepID=UPI002FFA24B7